MTARRAVLLALLCLAATASACGERRCPAGSVYMPQYGGCYSLSVPPAR